MTGTAKSDAMSWELFQQQQAHIDPDRVPKSRAAGKDGVVVQTMESVDKEAVRHSSFVVRAA